MGTERRATDSAPTRYRPRRPSESVLYRCVQQHLETWLAQCRDGHDESGRCRNMWSGSSAVTWNAESSHMALPGPGAGSVGTTS